jgi:branched-chain amino acid transport system permease protein
MLQPLIDGLLIGGIYALYALGFSLVFGVQEIANLAHGEFMMLGAFITYWLFRLYSIEPFLTIPVSFLILFVLGYFLQKFLINPISKAELMPLLLTFGLSLLISNLALTIWNPDYRMVTPAYSALNFNFAGITFSFVRLVTFAIALAMYFGLSIFLQKTDVGRAIIATAQNRERAALLGVNCDRIYSLSFAVGAGFAGVAGSLISLSFVIFPSMGGEYLLLCFCITVLGGMGCLEGALAAGLLLGIVNSLVTHYLTSGLMYILTFVLLFLVLVVRPAGIFGKGKV